MTNAATDASAQRSNLNVLDGVRGGASAYVMVGHAFFLLAAPAGLAVGIVGWRFPIRL